MKNPPRVTCAATSTPATPAPAIAAAAAERFDLLISDIGLPDGDGCDLLLELRRTHTHLRAIAVTGRAEEDFSERCRAAGFSAFVRKPASFAQLLAAVDSAGPARS